MRNLSICLLFFFLVPVAAQAQDFVTTGQVTLLVDKGTSLNSDRKDKLALIDGGRAVNGCVFLPKDTLLKVVSRQQFEVRGTVSTTNNSTPKKTFEVAYVNVVNGDQKGQAGWIVVSTGRGQAIAPTPANYEAAQANKANAAASAGNSSDLVIGVSRGDSRMQVAGKEVFSISVANKGGIAAKGGFTVSVEVDGKVVKTERVRDLGAGESHYFNAEISESAVRKGATLVVKVDPQNTIKEGDETNNVFTQKL